MDFHGTPMNRTWVRLGKDVKAGDTEITLNEQVTGWKAGDRIIVTEDTTTFFDDAMQRALKPLGINPAKKKDPLADRYEFRD